MKAATGLICGVVVGLGAAVMFAPSNGGGMAATTHQGPCVRAAGGGSTTLDPTQSARAKTIIDVGRARSIPPRGIELAIATALVESDLKNLASRAVPESITYANDGVAAGDADSVGIMQQRPSMGWGTVAELMRVDVAATRFYDALAKVSGWERMGFSAAAQAVQRSAFPDRYGRKETQARSIVAGLAGGVTGTGCAPGGAIPATTAQVKAVVEFAFSQRGKPYLLGGNGPDIWDCSSLAQAAWRKAGIDLPRTAQLQRDYLAAGHGKRIQPGQEAPGDLIFWDSYLGGNEIGHVVMVLDPRIQSTIEAHGRADGVGVFSYKDKAQYKNIFEIWRPGV